MSKSRLSVLTLTNRDYVLAIIGALLALVMVALVMVLNNQKTALPYRSEGVTISWLPSSVSRWNKTMDEMAKKYDIDANLLAILMTMESGGNPKAKSGAGAIGLMQVTPPTAKDIARRYVKEPVSKYDLYDPRTSIEFGAAYLALMRNEFGAARQGPEWTETVELVAAGYNGGGTAPNAIEQGEGLRNDETIIYSRDAFNMWRERNSKSSPTFDRWKERGGTALLEAAK